MKTNLQLFRPSLPHFKNSVEEPFSGTGIVSATTQSLFQKMNRRYALWNCGVVALKGAVVLEFGYCPKGYELGLSLPNRPRPMSIEGVLSTSVFSQRAAKGRDFFVLKDTSKYILDLYLEMLGAGTHALIAAIHPNDHRGHFFNYVCEKTESGALELEIYDGYSKRHYLTGRDRSERYLARYRMQEMDAMIFYEVSEKNIKFLMESGILPYRHKMKPGGIFPPSSTQ